MHTHLNFQIKHRPIKRVFDIVFSFCALLFCLPLFILIVSAIRFNSKGKIIYAHTRVGRGGIPFKCYKFRTMYPDADQRLQELLSSNPNLQKEWDTTHKLKNDPRVTTVGKFLRKTSLDEFPQFWNVLIGDLSIVGPRPVVDAEITKFLGPKAEKILSIRPGITGLWQVSGRNDTSYQHRILLDEKYIENASLLFDLKLIVKTIPAMISSKGAY